MAETHPLTSTFMDTTWYHNAAIGILSRTANVETEGRQCRRGGSLTLGQTIIDTACDFVELGFQATTPDKVVKRAKLWELSIYWHFENKEALFTAPSRSG